MESAPVRLRRSLRCTLSEAGTMSGREKLRRRRKMQESHEGNPTRRSRSLNRGADRRLSKIGSTFR